MSVQKTVMVFGVFDGLHNGHRYFLSAAMNLGCLIVVVARNKTVGELKDHLPIKNSSVRVAVLRKEYPDAKVISGDIVIGSWNVIRKEKPDSIALGYDQKPLEKELRKFIIKNKLKIPIKIIKSYKPNIYHSRLLNKLKHIRQLAD